ncbi:MAG: hypothetical protein GVY16_04700 [Planctomycetes bacterium]|nr:hypothetical protein [Planctomycetota bacterium]
MTTMTEFWRRYASAPGRLLARAMLRLTDPVDLRASRAMDISDVESVCVMLGPYRNLTTLTASVMFLHPQCQVLNHAGRRIFGRREVDFLEEFSCEKLDRFIQFAIRISGKGRQGACGGSITHSHAFDARHAMQAAAEQADVPLIKPEIRCLFWKESHRVTNRLRDRPAAMHAMLQRDGRLRFLLPVRHPLDCAVSNIREGYEPMFPGLDTPAGPAAVMRGIVDDVVWFARWQQEYPQRFFHFFAFDASVATLVQLAGFMGLDPREDWLERAMSVVNIRSRYQHEASLIEAYREYVDARTPDMPNLRTALLALADRPSV